MGLLDGKVCLITGTHRGIGAATLQRFVEEGATVYANARTVGCMDERCAALSETGPGTAIPVYFDVTDVSAMKEAVTRIKKEQGHWDVLVNNAGIMQDALIGMVQHETMERVFQTNVFAAMEALQFAAKIMRRQESGSIINFASIVGTFGNRGQLVYSASKGAVIAMTKTAAKELAPSHIRVNAVAPGMIDTDMFRSVGEDRMDDYLDGTIGFHELGTPGEVADSCVFLASDLSYYVTGQILGIDGAAVI